MAVFKEQCHMKSVPRELVLHAITNIAEALITDAKRNFGGEFGFHSRLDVNAKEGIVFCQVRFIPYDYRFKWLVSAEQGGFLVTLIGATPGSWHETLTGAPDKMQGLVNTQWSALFNFALGFVTAQYYAKAPKLKKKEHKEHIRKAAKKVTKRKKHKKTKID